MTEMNCKLNPSATVINHSGCGFKPLPAIDGMKRILVFSDVHLLHPRVPTWHIVDVLIGMISSASSTLKAIYIAGDLFDDSRQLRQTVSHDAMRFVTWLLCYCKEHNIAIRVLEGTPSHDHGQSRVLEKANEAIGADFVYMDGIGIFYDPAIEATIGWVQDEYHTEAQETEREMAELMKTRCIEKVDFFFMHGMFKFQIPVERPFTFDEQFWLSRCRFGIYIGHDHRKKSYDRITVMGSPERLAHGEEEAKGMAIVDFNDQRFSTWFYENPYACPQRKVRYEPDYDKQYKSCLDALRYIDEHPSSSIGRLEIEYVADSPLAAHVDRWKREYPFFIKGDKIPSPEEEKVLLGAFAEATEFEVAVSPENVEKIMLDALDNVECNTDIVIDTVRMLK